MVPKDAAVRPDGAITSFDVDDPELRDWPYPRYAQLRQTCPVGYSERRGGYWVLSRAADIRAVFGRPDVFSSRHVTVPPRQGPPEWPLELDPPEHATFRLLLGPAFSPGRVRRFERLARESMRRLVASIADSHCVEFVGAVAIPHPHEVLVPFIGLPPEDAELFLEWENRGLRRAVIDAEAARVSREVIRPEIRVYLDEQVRRARARGLDDDTVLSALLNGTLHNGTRLTDDEVVSTTAFLFAAGLHTTTSVLANMVWYLASHPSQRELLVQRPELITLAVEELLRYESIVSPSRVVTQDVEIGGVRIRAGDMVMLLTGSAGRDDNEFSDADTVDFGRSPNRHMAFGAGIHRCLGAHLARMELRVALEELLRAAPGLCVVPDKPVRRHTGIQRGTDEVYLDLHPTRPASA